MYILHTGGNFKLRYIPGRILIACFWFFVIAVTATYTGNLVAFLTVTTLRMPFNTLNGQSHHHHHQLRLRYS